MNKSVLLIALCMFSCAFSLTFTNKDCNGGDCIFQVSDLSFDGYTLKVAGKNGGNTAIPGGEVRMYVETKFLGIWIEAYDSTDPTCSYEGTDCKSGNIAEEGAQKNFALTMSTTPPSGTYRGSALFYYINENDTKDIEYAHVSMEWKCDSSECY